MRWGNPRTQAKEPPHTHTHIIIITIIILWKYNGVIGVPRRSSWHWHEHIDHKTMLPTRTKLV